MSDPNALLRKLALGLSLLASLQLTASLARGADAEIETVRFRLMGRLADDPTIVQRWYMTAEEVRMELPGQQAAGVVQSDLPLLGATIESVRLKQRVEISFLEKRAVLAQLDEASIRRYQNPVAMMRKIVANEAEQVREEKVAGRMAQVSRLKKLDLLFVNEPVGEKDSATLWVDRETKLPVRIEFKFMNLDGQGECEMVFDEFAWNEPLDAKLFALKPPAGFAVDRADATKQR